MTEKDAVKLAESGFWKDMSAHEIASFQLQEGRLCMPFGVFHESVEKALGRPVYTHEFASPKHLRAELFGDEPAPTFEEIIAKLPDHVKVIFIDPKGANASQTKTPGFS
jgi:hypothetical protein